MNEETVGNGLRASGVERKELFVTSKLSVHDAGYERARLSAHASRALSRDTSLTKRHSTSSRPYCV